MEKKIIIIVLILILIFSTLNFFLKPKYYKPELSLNQMKELASDLKSKGLYLQAIKVYQDYLSNFNLSSQEKANINFIIAEIYRENLKDFENALLYYMKVKHLQKNSPLIEQVNQKIVECLENSGRSREAQLALEEISVIGEKKIKSGDVIVAKIDNENITLREFEEWIKNLPPEIRQKYSKPEDKKLLLEQFIGEELAYRMALRKGLQNDPEILKNVFMIKRNLMISKLLQTELNEKISVNKNDLMLYYNANKSKYKNRPFEEVYQEVYGDYIKEKYQQQFQILMEKMLKANRVEIFDGNIK